ncbi:NAD-dependent epimerase/dehydratase family protein [Gaetbulibacter saemankumensis]|uniref:NAD-dependent epimerase/dehydratase family protein n=1 Tax=Gaetbulibacter saemankumensis TaxID=311208 RepID=UPI0004142F23|nr:NAD-dependent epimerase/dehydratase family protein [Gaetbulibacter saemankumensis]
MILVTGGTGLVGAHLLYNLVNSGEKTRAIYRNEKKLRQTKDVFACYTNNYQLLFDKIEWVQADIQDIPSLEAAFNQVTHVYHCAAFVSFEPDKYALLRKINIEGTANIVNMCLEKNIQKLCYVSSISTLGKPINNELITEDTHWNPENENTVYAITKYGAEMEVWRATQEGLNAVIVNPGVILGSGIWKYGTGSLFKKAKKGIKYYTQGKIALIDVKDVIDIMTRLMASSITNQRFILVAENWSYKKFLQNLAESVKGAIPNKLASKGLLSILWRLDWLAHKLIGKRRQLTKHLCVSLSAEKNYSSDKIIEALNYKFTPIEGSLKSISDQFLKQDQ